MNSFENIFVALAPITENLENKRLELKSEGKKTGLIAGLITAAVLFIVVLLAGAPVIVGFGLGVVFFLILFFVCINNKSSELTAYYKKDIVSKLIESQVPGAEYHPNKGISQNEFHSMNLFNKPDRYKTEDLIKGKIDKTDFGCAEVVAEERHVTVDSKGRRTEYWSEIFNGFIFIADFHKHFNGVTKISRDSLFKFSFAGERVKLENIEFEKLYDVYSTDQVEARYLLSPSMMEKFIALDKKFKGDIVACFNNSSIYIAIPDSENHFEASIWKNITKDMIEKEFSLIFSLISIINELNLNTRIWSKQ